MRSLFDVNVLLAILDSEHIHHEIVRSWWAAERPHGWASTPIIQNGFLRIISQASYERPRPIAEAVALLGHATTTTDHAFWPDDLSILDTGVFDPSRLLGPRRITHVYLLGLAVKNAGRLVTLDRGIAVSSVRGAQPDQLVVLP